MTRYDTIVVEKKNHVAKLTMNRPEVLNAINAQMFSELLLALKDISSDDDVRVMVLTGAGRAFTAATDIKEEKGDGDRLLAHMSWYEVWQFIRTRPQVVAMTIRQMPKPTIAMVNGFAVADGFDWALACDMRFGSEKARFMNAFLQMGLVSNTGATWLYPRAMGTGKALELLYSGEWLEAQEAYRIGVLNRLIPAERLEEETMSFAAKVAAKPPIPNRLVKEMVYRSLTQPFETHLLEAAYAETFTLTTDDHKEALAAFLEKRQPKFEGK